MSSAKGTKSDSGAKKRLRKKRTLALIKSLDGSLYKHFTTTPDPPPPPSGPSTSPTATSTNPSRESFEDVLSVASGERSFSKLKLIKTYLRANMTQERLVGLAMLSIENEIASSLDFSNLLTTFANSKARKVSF